MCGSAGFGSLHCADIACRPRCPYKSLTRPLHGVTKQASEKTSVNGRFQRGQARAGLTRLSSVRGPLHGRRFVRGVQAPPPRRNLQRTRMHKQRGVSPLAVRSSRIHLEQFKGIPKHWFWPKNNTTASVKTARGFDHKWWRGASIDIICFFGSDEQYVVLWPFSVTCKGGDARAIPRFNRKRHAPGGTE